MHHSFLYEERFTREKNKVFVKNTDRMFLLIKKLQNVNSAFVSFHSHTHEHTQSVAVQFFFFQDNVFSIVKRGRQKEKELCSVRVCFFLNYFLPRLDTPNTAFCFKAIAKF